MLKKEKSNADKNKDKIKNTHMLAIAYFYTILMLLLVFYLIYFTAVKSSDIIDNPYNKRIEAMEDNVIRGSILADDNSVLAQSDIMPDGTQVRRYTYGNIFSHAVGMNTKGKSGIEKDANLSLITSNENPVSKIINALNGQKNTGDSVVTTLNVKLSKAAYEALGSNKGAVIAIEPSTGKILAMVSKPDFDPNTIDDDWESVSGSEDAPLFNRCLNGLYPPGSVFKTVTLLEYIREYPSYADFSYDCTGQIESGGMVLNCINGTAHGTVSLKDAFAKSCNGAFASIGLMLDKDRFKTTAQELLFNTKLPSAVECSESSFDMGDAPDDAVVMQTSIGQGQTLMTPMHGCMLASAIANDGVLMKPYIVSQVCNADGTVIKNYSSSEYKSIMTKEESDILTDYMREVVSNGTAHSLKDSDYMAAGKTGSAQYDSSNRHHSWFIGFAPYDSPKIAVCVVLEGGYSGVSGAHETAKAVFDAYFNED